MMDKVLTISIAAYNAEKYLCRCVDSIVHSEYAKKIEIIIVNDGSTDRTAEIAHRYEARYSDSVRVIDKENGGHGSTINISISEATGRYFKLVDSDDWVETSGMNRLIEYLETANADIVLNPYYEVDSLTRSKRLILTHTRRADFVAYDMPFDDVAADISLPMHGITYRVDIVKKMGPIIDENCFYVDAEYAIFPMPYIKHISILDNPVYDYLLGTEEQSVNLQNMIRRRTQHFTVLESLIRYYCDSSCDLSEEKNAMMIRRILEVIISHYRILLRMRSKTAKMELIDFDDWLRQNAPDSLYEGVICRDSEIHPGYAAIIKSLRKSRFKAYSLHRSALLIRHIYLPKIIKN